MTTSAAPVIEVRDLAVGYGKRIIQQNLNFMVHEKEIFCIMGGSGCGKSTLLKHLIGLYRPLAGSIRLFGKNWAELDGDGRYDLFARIGVTYQGGALLGSLTVAENVELPLLEHTTLDKAERQKIVAAKLEQVELAGFGSYYPAELSGGMKKRAGVARAMALDPALLFFDEPSAGLDPVTSAGLDQLILRLREESGTTIVFVSHELASIFTVADRIILLDAAIRTMVAEGDPRSLRANPPTAAVGIFLNRGGLHHQVQQNTMPSNSAKG